MASAMFITAPLFAQDKGTDKPAPTQKPVAERDTGKPTPASATAQKFSVPVTGLTAENAEKIQTSLAALSHTAWACPDCKMSQETKGKCTSCNVDLVSGSHKCLSNVKVDAAGGMVNATLNPGAMLKLSELERALGGASVKLDPAKLTLSGNTQLHIQGPGSAADAKKFEEGMKTAKIFESMEIKHEGDSRDYVITTQASANAPTKAAVASAITRAGGEGFKLVDVVWVGPKQMS